MRRLDCFSGLLFAAFIVFATAPSLVMADEPADGTTHRMIPAVIKRIEGSMLFVQPEKGLQRRVISIRKAERMGLQEAQLGEEIMLVLDENDVLVDVHRKTVPAQGHKFINGKLKYADPYWGVLKVETLDGIETFPVDTLAGSK